MVIFYGKNLEAPGVASFCVFPSDEFDEDLMTLPVDLF